MTVLSLGFLLGARHALDADHVAAVATLVSRHAELRTAAFLGLCWGVGHTLTLLAAGLAVIVLNVTIPARVTATVDLVVGGMLVILGGSLAIGIVRGRWHRHPHHHGGASHRHFHSHQDGDDHRHAHWIPLSRTPLAVGICHGLAGSSALVLLVVSAVQSVWAAAAYIVLFGVGSILGMVLLGGLIGIPFVLATSRARSVQGALQWAAALGSIGLGFLMLYGHGRA